MRTSGNTILITGGGTGIGRGLAQAFHARGNRLILWGLDPAPIAEAADAMPGAETLAIDLTDAAAVARATRELVQRRPDLNVAVLNAGIMERETLGAPGALDIAERTVATNLLAPMRLADVLVPALAERLDAAILTVSSAIAFVPSAGVPAYSASKAAIHAWTQTLRWQLRGRVAVHEIAPPYVQTGLMGERQKTDARAMPLADFVAETMAILELEPTPDEIIVERCRMFRDAEREERYAEVFRVMNETEW